MDLRRLYRLGIAGGLVLLCACGASRAAAQVVEDAPVILSDPTIQTVPDGEQVPPVDDPPVPDELSPIDLESPPLLKEGDYQGACEGRSNGPFDKKATAAYKGAFYDNNFDYLNDASYDDWHLGENLKRRCVGRHTVIDAGGEYRLRYQHEVNMRGVPLSSTRPAGVRNDDFWLQRTRLYLNAEYGDWLRGYAEAIDATSDGQRHPPRAIETNRFDALNLFAEARVLSDGCGSELWIRGGRQELLYGAQRLVSPLDWSDTRRTFDGVKLYYENDLWDIDGFWMRPIRFGQHLPVDTNFDSSNDQEEFVGVWAKYKGRPGTTVECYFLRLADYSGLIPGEVGGPGDADPNTFGAHLKGDWCGLLWEVEGGYQFGSHAQDTIQAGFCTLGLGHQFDQVQLKPTLWLYYDWASGDRNPTDGTHGTFNQYFPLGHKYLGFMDFIGRQNIQDLNLLATAAPCDNVTLLLWYHMFWLQQPRDAVYDPGGVPIYRDPTGASGNDLGSELDFLVQWTLTPRVNLWFGYSHFFTGDYFQKPNILAAPNSANGADADFFYTQLTLFF